FLIRTAGDCVPALDSTAAEFPAAGSSGSVTLTLGATCSWTAQSNVGWVSLLSATSGQGGASIDYSVAANSQTSRRSGTLIIAGLTYTVSQAAAMASCTYSWGASEFSVASGGGNG